MKLDPAISAQLAVLQPNQIGLLAWTLLAHPPTPLHAGGVPPEPKPGPAPDTPEPPGVPTIPDEKPPTPMA